MRVGNFNACSRRSDADAKYVVEAIGESKDSIPFGTQTDPTAAAAQAKRHCQPEIPEPVPWKIDLEERIPQQIAFDRIPPVGRIEGLDPFVRPAPAEINRIANGHAGFPSRS